MQIPALIGFVIACYAGGYLSDVITTKRIVREGGQVYPEQRLISLLPGCLVGPVGCIVIAFSCSEKLHWIGIAFGFGMGKHLPICLAIQHAPSSKTTGFLQSLTKNPPYISIVRHRIRTQYRHHIPSRQLPELRVRGPCSYQCVQEPCGFYISLRGGQLGARERVGRGLHDYVHVGHTLHAAGHSVVFLRGAHQVVDWEVQQT